MLNLSQFNNFKTCYPLMYAISHLLSNDTILVGLLVNSLFSWYLSIVY